MQSTLQCVFEVAMCIKGFFFLLNWRQLRPTLFCPVSIEIQENWPDWPQTTEVNLKPY